MGVLTKLSLLIFGNKHPSDQAVDSVVICVKIGNLNLLSDKFPPQELVELIRAINNRVETILGKYKGVVASYNPGTVCGAIPDNMDGLDSRQLVCILQELRDSISGVYPKHIVSLAEPFLGIGVDSGMCLISEKSPLILGDAVNNAGKICQYALDSNSEVLISSNIVGVFTSIKNSFVEYGVVPDTRIKVWRFARNGDVVEDQVNEVVKVITAPDSKRRVVFYRRHGKVFGFEEEWYSDEPMERCWIPFHANSFSMCDSFETALSEAKGRIEWLGKLVG